MLWQSIVEMSHELPKLQSLWLSLLCRPGQLIKHMDTEMPYLVLAVTEWGALAAEVEFEYCGLARFVKVVAGDGGRLVPHCCAITNLHSWQAYVNAEPHCPVVASAAALSAHRGIRLQVHDLLETLHEAAARRAFPDLTCPRLELLCRELGIPPRGRAQKTEHALLYALLSHILPDLGHNDVEAIIARRCKPTKQQEAVEDRCQLMNADNMEVASADLNGTDISEDAKALKEKRARRRAVAKQTARPSPPPASPAPAPAGGVGAAVPAPGGAAASGGLPAVAPVRAPLAPWPGGEEWTAAEAAAFVPPNCTIHKELKWHHRWKGEYKNKKKPNAVSKTFAGAAGLTETQALRFVLAQLWTWHEGETEGREQCPYDLRLA